MVAEYKYRRLFSHLSLKSKKRNATESRLKVGSEQEESNGEEALPSEMSDQELEAAIRRDLRTPLPHHSWSDLADLIESEGYDSSDTLLLTALLNQSKILIRQNELILRILRSTFAQSPRSSPAAVAMG